MMRKYHAPILAGLFLTIALVAGPGPAKAQGGSAADLIAAVNALRASNGLPPLQADSALMSIAQAHSNYQASIGSVTHTGAGGTRPRDRAAAAGYGGGATIFVSENIAGGTNLSVEE
ncbi:MAG: CAP domain-containing protein, partial [Anaerolineales bacterium]|nr:CAP domain-containing protein [Anaerolineales bacterium]